ncbi:hypothetical protein [uncultured Jannaschia sp.]|uniref:hypothetical protein n=1 Tax=uncultured Jannaschia sp. TaxID=293347 RepID=UPI0026231D00|nr:hypothetical protein [uncultured Jannaschia sp.]
MSDDSRYRGGRAIASILEKLGWLAAIGGIGVAGWVSMTGGPTVLDRIAAGLPGFGLMLLGLIAICVAALTRATMDGSEAMREMAQLTRDRARHAPDARLALRAAAEKAPPRPVPAPVPEAVSPEPAPLDDVPPAPPSLGIAPTRAKLSATKPDAPTAPAKPAKSGKVHPIFSARPPRQTS